MDYNSDEIEFKKEKLEEEPEIEEYVLLDTKYNDCNEACSCRCVSHCSCDCDRVSPI